MANLNKPTGLSPVKYLGGADWDERGNLYYIAPADTGAYYVGDLVDLTGTGDAATGLQGITLATAGNPAVGVVMAVGTNKDGGPYINPNDLTKVFRPSGAQPVAYYALVADDPNIIFEAQETAGVLVAANVSRNVNITYAAPATGVFLSGTIINGGSQAVTATLNLKLLGLKREYSPSGATLNTYGANSKWLCLINNHRYRAGIAGV